MCLIQTAAAATTVAKALAVNDGPNGSQGEPQLFRRLLVADGLKVKGPAHANNSPCWPLSASVARPPH